MNRAIYDRLVEAAKGGDLVSYRQVARRVGLDMGLARDSARIRRILTKISGHEHEQGRPLLSAVVTDRNRMPRKAFFTMAQRHGVMREDEDELEFWLRALRAVYEHWLEAGLRKKRLEAEQRMARSLGRYLSPNRNATAILRWPKQWLQEIRMVPRRECILEKDDRRAEGRPLWEEEIVDVLNAAAGGFVEANKRATAIKKDKGRRPEVGLEDVRGIMQQVLRDTGIIRERSVRPDYGRFGGGERRRSR